MNMITVTARDRVLSRDAVAGILTREGLRKKLGLAPLPVPKKLVTWNQILAQLKKIDPEREKYIRKKLAEKDVGLDALDILRRERRFGTGESAVGRLLNRQELSDLAELARTGKTKGYQYPLSRILFLARQENILSEKEFEVASSMYRANTETPEGMYRFIKRKQLSDEETLEFLCSYFSAQYRLDLPVKELGHVFNAMAEMLSRLYPQDGALRFSTQQKLAQKLFPDRRQQVLLPSAAALIRQRKGRESVVRAAGKTFAEDSRYAWGNYIGQLATLECRNISHAIFYIAELIALTFEKGKIDPGAAGQMAFAASRTYTKDPGEREDIFDTVKRQFLPKKKQQEEYDSVVHRTIADPPADRETVTVRQGALAGEVLKRGAGGVRTSLWAVLSAAGRAEMKNYLPPELSVQTLMVREQGRGAAKEVLLRCSIRQALGLPLLEATSQEVKIEDLIAATDKYLTAMLQQCREEGLSVNIHELTGVDSVIGSKKFSAKVKALALVRDIAAAGSQSIAPTSSGTSAGRMLDEHLPGRVKSQGSIIGEAAKILFNVNEEVTAGTVPAYLEFILAANRILPLATFGENALFFWQVERALGQAEGSFVGQAMRLLIGHAPEKTLQEMIIDDLLTTLKLELQRERGVKEAYYRAIRE